MRYKPALLLLVLCMTLTSCNLVVDETPDNTLKSTESTESTTTTPPYQGIRYPLVITSRTEYDQFIDESREMYSMIPYFSHFVHVDRLLEVGVGDFIGFSYYEGRFPLYYCYEFVDQSVQYNVDVFHEFDFEGLPWSEQGVEQPPDEDLRYYIEENGTYFYFMEDICYHYDGGELRNFFLKFTNCNTVVKVSIYGSPSIACFPQNEENLISRLLNKSTALEAKAELDALFSGE